MMSAMTHLDFYRVLSHHHCVETRHPLRLGVPLNTTPNGLPSVRAAAGLWEIGGDATVSCARQHPINGCFNEAGATP